MLFFSYALFLLCGFGLTFAAFRLHHRHPQRHFGFFKHYILMFLVSTLVNVILPTIAIALFKGSVPATNVWSFFGFLLLPLVFITYFFYSGFILSWIGITPPRTLTYGYFTATILFCGANTWLTLHPQLFLSLIQPHELYRFINWFFIALYLLITLLATWVAWRRPVSESSFKRIILAIFLVFLSMGVWEPWKIVTRLCPASRPLPMVFFLLFHQSLPLFLLWRHYAHTSPATERPTSSIEPLPHCNGPELPTVMPRRGVQLMKEKGLSTREQEIAWLLFDGKTNKEIEDDLFISIHTVKSHVYTIYRKMGAKNRMHLARMLRETEPTPTTLPDLTTTKP